MTAVKRLVLTGASGYVGQQILSNLIEKENLEIHALCRNIDGFARAVGAIACAANTQVPVSSLDLTDKDAVDAWVSAHSNLDLCLHLAAMSSPRVREEQPEQATATNNPVHWFNALSSQKIPIVALSTDQVYDGTKGGLYIETDPTDPVNVYGKSKVAMERYLRNNSSNNCVLLRSSIVLGPQAPFGNAHDTFLHFCATRNEKDTDFYTDECRTVIAVQDVVNVLLYFCENGVEASDTFNMGGKDRVSRYDMALAVFERFGYDAKYLVAKEKAKQPPGAVASPLDISMDSTKLARLTGIDFQGLDDIIQDTFP